MNPNTWQNSLAGTCLLIPPCEGDGVANKIKDNKEVEGDDLGRPEAPKHYIACLFTSVRYGSGKDKADSILNNTRRGMNHLRRQIERVTGDWEYIITDEDDDSDSDADEGLKQDGINQLKEFDKHWDDTLGSRYRAVKINSGRFGVAWKKSKAVLENGKQDILVVSRKEDDDNDDDKEDDKKVTGQGSKNKSATTGTGKRKRRDSDDPAKDEGNDDPEDVDDVDDDDDDDMDTKDDRNKDEEEDNEDDDNDEVEEDSESEGEKERQRRQM